MVASLSAVAPLASNLLVPNLSIFVELLVLVLLVVGLIVGLVKWSERSSRTRPVGDPAALPGDVLGLRQEVAALRAELAGALRHVGVVRYDAFGDVGGRLSWSLAMLDDAGDGVVLTGIHGRSEARSYAKSIAGWACDQPLSPEEEEAIASARPSRRGRPAPTAPTASAPSSAGPGPGVDA